MITSVRSVLNQAGKSASIRKLALERKLPFPLSLRAFVQAPPSDVVPPPGKLLKKTIPLSLIQSKFNQLFNNRSRPLIKVNLDGKSFGQSILTVYFDDAVKGYDAVISEPLAGPGKVLEFPGLIFGTHKFHLSDINSSDLIVHVLPGPPVSLQARVNFESEGVELIIDDFPNVNFVEFFIELKAEFSSKDGGLDLLGFIDTIDNLVESAKVEITPQNDKYNSAIVTLKTQLNGKTFKAAGNAQYLGHTYQFDNVKDSLRNQLINDYIKIAVDLNVNWLHDGIAAEKIESTINKKIIEGFRNKEKVRDPLKKYLTRIFLGGEFFVTGVTSDNNALYIDYILPPGELEPFPEMPQDKLDPGLLSNLDHIVVLMMENRSFDHMLGYLRLEGGRTDVDGLTGSEKNRYPLPESVATRDYKVFPLQNTQFLVSPNHHYEEDGGVIAQINGGKMDGFVKNFALRAGKDNAGDVMGYYQAKHVPVFDILAQEFLICQRWFCSHPGPTMPNRFYTLTGRLNRLSNGGWETENPSASNITFSSSKTIFEHLSNQGVSWRYYESGPISTIRFFKQYTFDNQNVVDASDFFIAASTGTLPSVSFIDPVFVGHPSSNKPANDDHPPADIAHGQRLIAEIIQVLMNGPKWNKTMLVVTYDEHGGFYDHVPPPKAPSVSGIDTYGPRVPTFVVSPWVKRGTVSDVVFDHTSILKTIARRFLHDNPPDMGERMRNANDLEKVMLASIRMDKPNIPVPSMPSINQKIVKDSLIRKATPSIENDHDFHELMRMLQERRGKQ